MTIEIFISYSHQDEAEKNELLQHLSVLRRSGLLDLWSDERIGIGEAWKPEIEEALIRARVAILLVTKNFLNSDFILEKEVPELLKRHEEGLTIIPIIARDCAWRSVGWLAELQVFNNGLPVWRDGGAHVDKELAEFTYLVDEQTAASVPPPEVSPAALPHTHHHVLFVSTPSVGESKSTTWLSGLRPKRKIATPAMTGDLYAAIDAAVIEMREQGDEQLSCQQREDGVIVATDGDVAILLGLAIMVLRTTTTPNGDYHRMALHSGEKVKATWNERTQLPREDVYIARRLMELGCEGHLLASQQFANLLRKDPEFASVFHNSGSRTINPPDSIEIYNVYKRGPSEDPESDFGNDAPPLRETPETLVRKLHAPRLLRALKNEWIRVTFWPGHSYIKVKFDFKNSDGEKARGVRIDCHKHGERGCSFEYAISDSKEEHQPKFKIVAEDPPADLSLVIEMSCYNEYDELLTPPYRRDIRLLRKPPLPSIKEPFGMFSWIWDRVMRLPVILRALAFAALMPILIMALYFLVPPLIRQETKDELTYDYEFYKRKHWYGYDTYVGKPWEEDFIDANPSHWSFDEGQVKIVKGDGEGNVDTGAMLIQSGEKMVVAGNLGSQAFYDFTAEFRLEFIEGQEAAWVFRAQPDRQRGYVFLLKREGDDLVLYGFKYNAPNKFESIDGDPKRRVLAGSCCYSHDYFDVRADVNNYTFKHQITISNFDDREAEEKRSDVTIGPYPVNDFTDLEEKYRCGSVGVLKPSNSKMQLEYWKVTPSPFPKAPAAQASH